MIYHPDKLFCFFIFKSCGNQVQGCKNFSKPANFVKNCAQPTLERDRTGITNWDASECLWKSRPSFVNSHCTLKEIYKLFAV
jgi:hypothetical protein